MKSIILMSAILLLSLNGLKSQDINFHSFTMQTIDGEEIAVSSTPSGIVFLYLREKKCSSSMLPLNAA